MAGDRLLYFSNPATGEQFGSLAMATPAEVRQAHQEMRVSFRVWSSKPVRERVRILRKLQAVLLDNLDEISEVINRETGKSRQDAMIEVFVSIDMLNSHLNHAPHWLRKKTVSRGLYLFKKNMIERRPYGVAAVISPWNYPFLLAFTPMVAALIAGNTVLLKPSEVTGATGLMIEKMVKRVPELIPYVRVLHGDGSVGELLVQSTPDFIFLTGSPRTGKLVAKAAADHLIPMTFELGGKDPMIVLEDADLAAAARWGAWGAYYNAGQACMSVERVYVVEQVYDEFLRLAIEETRKLKLGYSPNQDAPLFVGPISDPRQLKTIARHLEDALAKGAKIEIGGKINGLFVEPTVLTDVDHSMLIMRDETFGPFMPVMKVRDEEEAIQLANDCPLGLSASVWSPDTERAMRVASRIQAGSVVINDTIAHFAVPMLPFGGTKQSGYGRIHGEEGLLQFTQSQGFAVGGPPPAIDIATKLREPGHYHTGSAIAHLVFGVTPKQKLKPILDWVKMSGSRRSVIAGLGLFGALTGLAFSLLHSQRKKN